MKVEDKYRYLAFGQDEILYRRCCVEDLDDESGLVPGSLILQISTYRELLLPPDKKQWPYERAYNGFVGIKVSTVENIHESYFHVRCVWEPTTGKCGEAHSLITIYSDLPYNRDGDEYSKKSVARIKEKIAAAMRVKIKPT